MATITALVGEAPIGVKLTTPGQFLVHFRSLESAKKLTALQGRTFRGRTETLSARIQEVKLSVSEIFDLIQHKLKTREMASEFSPHRDFVGTSGRAVRESKRSKSPPPPQPKPPMTSFPPKQKGGEDPHTYKDALGKGQNVWHPVGRSFPPPNAQKGKGGKGSVPYYPFKSRSDGGKGSGIMGGRGGGKGKGAPPATPSQAQSTSQAPPAPQVATSSNSA